jgi:signal transduction histidine kinase
MLQDPQAAHELLAPALERAIDSKAYANAVPLLHQLAIIAFINGDDVKKNALNKEAIRYARLSGNQMLIANSLTKLAKDYRKIAKPDSAASMCLDAVEIYKSISAEGYMWACKVILGDIASDAGRFSDAEQHYLQAWDAVRKLDDSKDEFIVAGILQNFYITTKQSEKYAAILENLVGHNPYFTEELNEGNVHYHSLLRAYQASSEPINDLKRSISLHRRMDHPLSLHLTMSRLGYLLTLEGRYEEGFDTLKKTLLLPTYSIPSRMALYYQLYINRHKAGDPASALMYLEKYHTTKDTLLTEKAQAHIRELEVRYQTKEKEIALLKEQERTRQRTVQRNLLMGAAAVIIWFSLFGILFFWNQARLQKQLSLQNDAIHHQKIQQLEQEKKMLAMSSMIGGQEAERKRIARDLHDGLGGLLSSVKAQLNLIQHQVNNLASGELYTKANNLIDTASAELRRIAYNMMPSSLSRLGLKAALEDLCASLENDHHLEVNLQVLGMNSRLNETTEIMIYRIVQELCTNVVRHAQASRLLIQVNRMEDELFLIVEDNGIGIDPSKAMQSSGIGMKSIESRVKFLNGTIDISGGVGKGTCVSVHVPLET